jgi:hypothetical protein
VYTIIKTIKEKGAIVMSTRKSIEEQLAEVRSKKTQLAEKEKRLKAQQKEHERKARTKRLIQLGGIVEKVLGRPTTEEDLPKLLDYLEQQEKRGNFFSKAMNKPTPTTNASVDTSSVDVDEDNIPF